MGRAKDILVKPIKAKDAKRIIRSLHYSHRVDPRSSVHLGVFMDGVCGGAIQLGIPIHKKRALLAVGGTPWNGMLEINRIALADWLPRNSESRAIGFMLRWIRRNYPFIQWIQSYADATQCGDGAIYRATGFLLIGIKRNSSMWRLPSGEVVCDLVFSPGFGGGKRRNPTSTPGVKYLKNMGAVVLPGYQLRYIYFIDKTARERLTVPILDYKEICRMGASMYRGEKISAGSIDSDVPGDQPGEGGANPTSAL